MALRRLLSVFALVLVLGLLIQRVQFLLDNPTIWPPDDYVEYWAASQLNVHGQDPYSPELLLPLERQAGRDTPVAVMMWNPPWTLTVVLPLGLLPARTGQLLWLIVHSGLACYCGDRLWLRFGGARSRRGIGWGIALLFVPTLYALQSGQISLVLLFGVVLFLECQDRGWHLLAGAALVLLAVKPHLAGLVWLAVLADAIQNYRVRILLGGIATGVLFVLIPLAFNPDLLRHYADAWANHPPDRWKSLTLGVLLRFVFGLELFSLQFAPVPFAIAWFAWYRWHHRHCWDWNEQMPMLLLVSFLTSPYGNWPYDMVLLLPAAMQLLMWHAGWSRPHSVERPPRAALILAGLLLVQVIGITLMQAEVDAFLFIWVCPFLFALYLLGRPPRRGVPV